MAPKRKPSLMVVHLKHFDDLRLSFQCSNRAAAYGFVNADRLARLIVDEVQLRQTKQRKNSVAHLEFGLDG